MPVVIYYHPDCELHEMGPGHPENPQRLQAIIQGLKGSGFAQDLIWRKAPLAQREDLFRAHDAFHVDTLMHSAPQSGYLSIDPDTLMNPKTLQAAFRAAGSLIAAVDTVLDTPNKKVFCAVRPPGHHAERDRAMGFCFFNNIAVGALYALEMRHLKRIAIVDIDVHHGNGTQDILGQEPRVLFCSAFEHPFFPGTHLDTNEHILHAPAPYGTGSELWRKEVQGWFKKIEAFAPECILVSAGFDAHRDDELAGLNLDEDDFAWVSEHLSQLAEKVCQGRLIATLEGGYDLPSLTRSVVAFVQAMNA